MSLSFIWDLCGLDLCNLIRCISIFLNVCVLCILYYFCFILIYINMQRPNEDLLE